MIVSLLRNDLLKLLKGEEAPAHGPDPVERVHPISPIAVIPSFMRTFAAWMERKSHPLT